MDTTGLPDLAREANWVDWALLLLLFLAALEGLRRGLVQGTLDLLGGVVGFAAAVLGYPVVAEWLTRVLPTVNISVPEAAMSVVAFILVLVVAQAVYSIVAGWLGGVSRAVLTALPPLSALDRLLGLVPGLVRGLILCLVLLLPFTLLPVLPDVSTAIGSSVLGSRLVGAALAAAPEVEARLGRDLASGLPSLILTPPSPQQSERIEIGPTGAVSPDAEAEQRMLELVNQERVSNGLRPLTFDEELRPVARAHSREMFERGYFSHTSPVTGSPFDRFRAAGVRFGIAGENLAYARNVQTAHDGLMKSPGHRANILRPEFGRVGIGVMRSDFQGSMYTQNFRD